MSYEEIRLECLKLATSMMGDVIDDRELFAKSNIMFRYVLQIEETQENRIEFAKINLKLHGEVK